MGPVAPAFGQAGGGIEVKKLSVAALSNGGDLRNYSWDIEAMRYSAHPDLVGLTDDMENGPNPVRLREI